MDFDSETFFGLHFQPRHDGDGSHVLPVQNLIQALEGLQRTIHLVAMMKEGREVKSRARVTRDIEDRFQLHCEVPKEGSYYQPTFIAERDKNLSRSDETKQVAEITRNLLSSIARWDEQNFKQTVVDSAFRTPIISSLGKMFGGQGGHYCLAVEDKLGNEIVDSVSATDTLERLRQARLSPDDTVINMARHMAPASEHLLDWFHITMRITVMQQYVKGLAHHNPDDALALSRQLRQIKSFLWNGNLHDGPLVIEDLVIDLDDIETGYASIKALRKTATEFQTYIANNADMIPNYAERRR